MSFLQRHSERHEGAAPHQQRCKRRAGQVGWGGTPEQTPRRGSLLETTNKGVVWGSASSQSCFCHPNSPGSLRGGTEGNVLLCAWRNGVLALTSSPDIVLKIRAGKSPAGCQAQAGQQAKGLARSHLTDLDPQHRRC